MSREARDTGNITARGNVSVPVSTRSTCRASPPPAPWGVFKQCCWSGGKPKTMLALALVAIALGLKAVKRVRVPSHFINMAN